MQVTERYAHLNPDRLAYAATVKFCLTFVLYVVLNCRMYRKFGLLQNFHNKLLGGL